VIRTAAQSARRRTHRHFRRIRRQRISTVLRCAELNCVRAMLRCGVCEASARLPTKSERQADHTWRRRQFRHSRTRRGLPASRDPALRRPSSAPRSSPLGAFSRRGSDTSQCGTVTSTPRQSTAPRSTAFSSVISALPDTHRSPTPRWQSQRKPWRPASRGRSSR